MKTRVNGAKLLLSTGTALALAIGMLAAGGMVYAATSPTLGAAGPFAILAETTITDAGNSSAISGDVGLSPASSAADALTCAQVTGTIYKVSSAGPTGSCAKVDAGLLTNAINAMMPTAFGALDQPCTTDYGAVTEDLTTVSPLGPGVYCANAFTLTGNLTLSGSGVWIFKSAATLTTSPGSSVTGGDPCNVWWRLVSAATLDTNTKFIGNILAGTSIALNTGATLSGRALAQAAVTLDHNTITNSCAASVPAASASPAASAAPAATAKPSVAALPNTTTEGAPPQGGSSPWLLVLVTWLVAVLAVGFGLRTYRGRAQ